MLAILLAMLLVIGCVGCSKTEEVNEEDAVKEVVTAFYDYSSEGIEDFEEYFEGMEKFLDPDGDLFEKNETTLEEYDDQLNQLVDFGFTKKEAEKYFLHVMNAMVKTTSYEIEEITITDDKAKVKLSVTAVDQDDMNTAMNSAMVELQQTGNYTSSSEFLDDVLEWISDYCEDDDNYTATTKTVTVVKVDGEWLISKVK